MTDRKLINGVSRVTLRRTRDCLLVVRLLTVVEDELSHDSAASAGLTCDGDVFRVAAEFLCGEGE